MAKQLERSNTSMGIEALKAQLAEGKITKEQFAAELKKLLEAGTIDQAAHDAAITASSATVVDPAKTDFTDEQLKQIQKLMQSEADKVRTKAAADKKILEDQLDALKTEKMSAEDKAKFNQEKLQKDLDEREKTLNARVVELHIVDKLTEATLPLSFKKFLVGETTEAADANITAFAAAWQTEIEAAVAARFKENGGDPPGGKGGGNPGVKKWNDMTLTEQSALYVADSAKARELAKAAGITLK
jgi:uncharacterized protein YnzC (UPF0291/DUF896 family)